MDKKKQDCKYWDKCYQRNAEHRDKYRHPPTTVASSSSPDKKEKTPESASPKSPKRRSPFKRSPCDSTTENDDREKCRTPRARSHSPDKKTKAGNSEHLQVQATHAKRTRSPNEEGSPSSRRPKCSRSESPSAPTKSPTPKKSPATIPSTTDESAAKQTEPERKEMDITKEYNEVMRNLAGAPHFEPDVVRFSQKAEYQELVKDPAVFIRHMFLVEMPSDFYKFWEFCKSQAKGDQKPERIFDKFGLSLVGPFDCLAGKFTKAKISEPGEYLRHWRFYYDPPEFQTIFAKQKSEIHYGYWRDRPKDNDSLLIARNDSSKGCEFDFVAANCFEAVLYYLENDAGITPFNRQAATALQKSLEEFAKANDISLGELNPIKKRRDRDVVCRTFHRAGLVVPFDRKTEVGYRGLIDSDAKLKKILSRFDRNNCDQKTITSVMEELQPFITAANIAVDECDFGTSIELGIDLFCSGHKELHRIINTLLVTGYSMVDRPQFIAIMKTHLEKREKGNNLSILS